VHALWTPDLYDVALERAFKHHVLPDMDRVHMIRVVPAFGAAPSSSLAYMLERVCERFGTPVSRTYAHGSGLCESDLLAALAAAGAAGEPVCLLGTTLAWAHVLDVCEQRSWSIELPPGSRLMHTGGEKGRRRSVSGAELLGLIEARFGIPRSHVVGEYGMTELGSQCYTLGLRHALHGEPDHDPQRWSFPFWLRPRLVDPDSGGFRPEVDVGLLAHHDLTNLGSVAHVLTADIGVRAGSAFVLAGRAPRAELRGCGLAFESTLALDSCSRPGAPLSGPAARVLRGVPRRTGVSGVPHLRAFHLPDVSPGANPLVSIGETGLRVPALDAASVAQAWEQLERGAETWRRLELPERVAYLARFAHAARAAGPAAWRDVLAQSTGLSPVGLDAAWEATFAPTTRAGLERLLESERLDGPTLERLATGGRLPRRIVHVLAGNVLPATWHVLVRGWLLGAAQWVRPATREPLFAVSILDLARRIAPELAAATAVLWWPRDASALEPVVLAAADAVTVQGDDASVASVRAKVAHWAPAARFVGYDSRWSAGWFEAAAQTAATARALARDVALFDQQGCLSPTWVVAEKGPGLEAWCGALARGLEALASALPPGDAGPRARTALRYWRACSHVQQALGDVARIWESPSTTGWCVVLLASVTEAASVPESPRDRHVVVVPFENAADLKGVLAARLDRLQGLSIGLETPPHLPAWLRPTRVARAGTLQEAPPDWRQDHHAPLWSLIRPDA
jgi:hypothetical protein